MCKDIKKKKKKTRIWVSAKCQWLSFIPDDDAQYFVFTKNKARSFLSLFSVFPFFVAITENRVKVLSIR